MNYLAHAYLSFGIPEITVGNMISDYVKGRKVLEFPPAIQQGIRLHRAIDQFTDQHPATAAAKQFFRPHYRLYSAAFVDVLYDHLLAGDEGEFTDSGLLEFSQQTYRHLDPFTAHFPEIFARMYPYMKTQNWLYNYRFRQGLKNSFGGLVRRAAYLEESDTAFRIFEENQDVLLDCYRAFMPEVKVFARQKLEELLSGI
jgi:acyl carrier protein phosphodiesterase